MKHTALFIGLTLVVAGFAACSKESSTAPTSTSTGGVDNGCISDPFVCAAGQTCWATSKADHFECQKSGTGKVGSPCMNFYDEPACLDGLTCFAVPNFPEVCTPFCDPMQADKGCTNGQKCQGLEDKASGATFYACAPTQGSGGAGGNASASSASGSASSTAASTAGPSAASSSASGAGGASSSSGGGMGGTGG